ncbi:Histone-lysine N-methyltransferase NSD3, partial [Tyrophagus putrescentiae]
RRRRRRGRPSLKKELASPSSSTDPLLVVSNCGGQTSLMAKIQDLSRRYPLPNCCRSFIQKVKLEARTCVLTDASLLRRYLIEDRKSEAPPGEAKYDLADIVWVKVRGQPWWPAMISVHPQRDCYLKYRSKDCLAYHVQTFAVIHHGWVSEREIRGRFQGWENFEADMLRRITACRLPAELEKTWKSFSGGGLREKRLSFSLAVAEAAAACRLTKAERLSTLTYRYYSKRYGKFFEA